MADRNINSNELPDATSSDIENGKVLIVGPDPENPLLQAPASEMRGPRGYDGKKGWSPVHAIVEVSASKAVMKLVDYIGGTGEKPTANLNKYLGPNGYVDYTSDAVNVRGKGAGDIADLTAKVNSHSSELEIIKNNWTNEWDQN